MNNEFCPDCGHLLSKNVTQCSFCGWSDRIDDLAYRGIDHDAENSMVFTQADEVYAELGITV